MLLEPYEQYEKAKRYNIMTPEDESSRSGSIQYTTGKEQRTVTNSLRKNDAAGLKWKQCSVVDVSGGKNKVQCCKEQYCKGTWDVRNMNKGKLDVVKKQKMTRVNISVSGISELKWT